MHEEPRVRAYDAVTQASLNGIYVKAQELDRGHNERAAPGFMPPGRVADAVSSASIWDANAHAGSWDNETHAIAGDADTHASDAETHASGGPA